MFLIPIPGESWDIIKFATCSTGLKPASIDIRNGQTQATHVLETVAVGMLAKEEGMKLNMVGCCTTDTLGFVEVMFYFYQ